MSIERYRSIVDSIGKAGAHALYPNEFEYYLMAFELVNSQDDVVDYIVLPVMPDSINHDSPHITNVTKTSGGVVAMDTSSFVPIDFQIAGNFGRNLKLVIGKEDVSFSALGLSTKSGVMMRTDINSQSKNRSVFDPRIKSGYGATKLFQSILDKSSALDDNNMPMRLYFYNMAFGESYLIKLKTKRFSQVRDSGNMIWSYSIQFTALAPLSLVSGGSSTKSTARLLTTDILQKNMLRTASSIKSML